MAPTDTSLSTADDTTVSADALMAFSADTHVGPAPEHLRPYCPEAYLERFDEFAATVDRYNASFEARSFSPEYWEGRRRNRLTEGHHDPHAWLRDMDADGVTGGVIFHDSLNGQPFPLDFSNMVGNGVPAPEARELAGVGRLLYNRWLADFCSVAPERTVGLAQLPFWDIDAAIAEMEWCADHGLRGVNFPSPGQPGLLSNTHADMDRFFGAAAALDMTLTTHIGAVPPGSVGDYSNPGWENSFHFGLLDAGEWGMRTVYQLVIFGAFERHSDLKLVLTEVPGVYWNEMCLKMDSLHKTPIRAHDRPLKRLPSEYAAEHVWLGNSFQSRQEAEAAIAIGRADRFMWGSDYPHPEGTYSFPEGPDEPSMTRLSLAFTYHGLPLPEVRQLLGGNAVDAYPRLDAAELARVAERVGIRPDEIAEAPDMSLYPYVHERGTLAFRTEGPWN
jgi:predicted TIM-barrel fold metal-dependent hydrolase